MDQVLPYKHRNQFTALTDISDCSTTDSPTYI